MHAVSSRQGGASLASAPASPACLVPATLPPGVRASIWRASDLGTAVSAVAKSGWDQLDAELPGGGWPCRSITEVLSPQPSVLEWRLVGPALRDLVDRGKTVLVIGPPKAPHLPGLLHCGLNERHLVWISAKTPAERLWCTEQLVKANSAGVMLAWLPQARPEQIRRLQVCAMGCDGPVFLFRPQAAAVEASAAPLRLEATLGPDWSLRVRLLKRRGPVLDADLHLPSIPAGLDAVLTPRLRNPSAATRREDAADVLGSNVIALHERQPVGAV